MLQSLNVSLRFQVKRYYLRDLENACHHVVVG